MIALHAALLAKRVGKPVRMIYDRHEDLAATTKRHPAIVRYRTGVTRDGRLVAQDIEVVMDGGAYCTLTPVVLSRGTLHAGGPYLCPNVRITRPRDGHQHAAQRRLPRLRRAADRVRRRDAGQPHRRGARHVAARAAPALGLPGRRRDADRPDPARERGRRGGPRTSRRGRRVRTRSARRHARSARGHAIADARPRLRARASASRWPGTAPVSPAAARSSWPASPSIELTGDGAHPRPDRVDRDGPGHQDDLSAARRRASWASPIEDVEMAPQDTSIVPDCGPTVASRTAMVVGGLVIKAADRLRAQVEERDGRPFARTIRGYARAQRRRCASTSSSSPIPTSTSTTRPTAATRIRPTAGHAPWRRWTSTSTRAR